MPDADVAVVGGGIIGTTAAVELQRRGHSVTIVEPYGAGAGTASGSAGYFAYDDVLPIPSPAIVAALPRMLLDRRGPLVVQPRYLPHLAGWGLRFLAAARPSAVRAGIVALGAMNRLARAATEAVAQLTGAERHLVSETVYHVCRTQRVLEHTAQLIPIIEREGFAVETIDRAQLLSHEPAVTGRVAGALGFPNSHRCTNPSAYGVALADHFTRAGGTVLAARATGVARDGSGWRVATAGGDVGARSVVIAAGAWSSSLLQPLGYRVPLETARGYHLMLGKPGVTPSRTLLFEEDHFCATPMEDGLRLAGTVEFAGLAAPPNFYRSDLLYDIARTYLPDLRRGEASRWMGNRPSLPDSLPVVGTLPRHEGIVVAFGHERRGFMQSAITARCVADLVERTPPPFDLTPLRIERFR